MNDLNTMVDTMQDNFERAVISFMEKHNNTPLSFSDWVIGYGLYDVGKKNDYLDYPFFVTFAKFLLNIEVASSLPCDLQTVEEEKRTIKFDLVQVQSNSRGM